MRKKLYCHNCVFFIGHESRYQDGGYCGYRPPNIQSSTMSARPSVKESDFCSQWMSEAEFLEVLKARREERKTPKPKPEGKGGTD